MSTKPAARSSVDHTASPATPAHRWPDAMRSLDFHDYRMLWLGNVVSNIGTWMQIMAQALVVYDLSNKSAFWLGADAFAAGIPMVLVPFAGVLADRLNRRKLLGIVTVMQACVAVFLTLMLYFNQLHVWEILICSAISGALSAQMVPTFVSLMPDLVDLPSLPNAIALNSLGFNVSRVIGPVVGAVALHAYGPAACFGLNAVSFISVLIALTLIRSRSTHHRGEHPHPLHSLREGLMYVRNRSDLIVMLWLSTISGFFIVPIVSMLPAFAHEVLGLEKPADERAYSWLLVAFGLGGLIGAAMLAIRSGRKQLPWRAFPILLLLGVVEFLCGMMHTMIPALLLVFIAGMCFIGTLTRLNTAMISSTPGTMRGRVSSNFFLSIVIGQPIGSLLAGMIAHQWGVSGIYLLAGMGIFVTTGVVMIITRKRGITFQGALESSPSETAATEMVDLIP